jgi:hypothetical protein
MTTLLKTPQRILAAGVSFNNQPVIQMKETFEIVSFVPPGPLLRQQSCFQLQYFQIISVFYQKQR